MTRIQLSSELPSDRDGAGYGDGNGSGEDEQ
mgnify:CR=1 FL=1